MEILQNQKTAIERFLQIRKFTEVLCAPLSIEDFAVQPISFVSPPKWHLAHTSWFFESFVLLVYAKNYKTFNPSYNYLFNSYYESVGERLHRSKRGNLNRPSCQEIIRYRAYINEQMANLLENSSNPAILQLTELGLQHEQQHQELLLTDIKYIFGHNPLFPVYAEKPEASDDIPDISMEKYRTMPEGIYNIGYTGNAFCYDNELGKHRVFIESYAFLNRLVTNGEYLEFIKDGGYKNFRFWLSEGWEKVNTEKWEVPLYWIKKEGEWFEFTLSGLKKLNPNLPVTHISYYEAAAFAEWKGKRLLTEAEWEVAAQAQPEIAGNFIESGIFHPVSSGKSEQFFGDCWEWTNSAYLPYPFYKRTKDALGEYNGKFMINQMVLRGGSCATPKSHIRVSYRNFFPPETRWQFSGIRLAKNS